VIDALRSNYYRPYEDMHASRYNSLETIKISEKPMKVSDASSK